MGSGTGKTATFTIGLLQNIDLSVRDCQALILAPTRELASQIVKVVMAIGDYLGVSTMACIGGTNVRQDMDRLRNGVQLVVGTPGRVLDMINRRALAVDYIHYFVLDEADEMLSRGTPAPTPILKPTPDADPTRNPTRYSYPYTLLH